MATDGVVTELAAGRRTRGLDRAFEILAFLREHGKPARPHEVAVGIGAPKSSVYELVNALLNVGVLEYSDGEGRVFLGRKLYFLGLAYQAHFDLTRECKTYLRELATTTSETAQLCMLDGNKYTVAMMHEGVRPFRISSDVGEPIPIPWTASGRLLVSHMSDGEILDFIPPGDFVLPDGSVLEPSVFLAETHGAREEGFFSFDTLTDTFTHCFAAPIYQSGITCAATLCLIAPREDARTNYDRYRGILLSMSRELTEKLAGDPVGFARSGIA
ncbi:MAG: IclR family transcriptional regulator [Bauldia sp.]|uniref:IclR family transcriptional regulator n=1 Tax=Bauldia sp. TaxID=2575872 RepID=UPI001D2B8D4A|nr:IclR family transcriptional regulator [Bauldia sp.]MCB1495823.1 IclR family transcriptional regulator [Bauldia sp.]